MTNAVLEDLELHNHDSRNGLIVAASAVRINPSLISFGSEASLQRWPKRNQFTSREQAYCQI